MCNTLTAAKDVDGISLASLAAVFTDAPDGFPPCTAAACVAILEHYKVPIVGKHVVVIGRSLVVGKPVSMMLLRRNASVTICHSRTENLQEISRSADIVICATGRARAYMVASTSARARRCSTWASTSTCTASCAATLTSTRWSPSWTPSPRCPAAWAP